MAWLNRLATRFARLISLLACVALAAPATNIAAAQAPSGSLLPGVCFEAYIAQMQGAANAAELARQCHSTQPTVLLGRVPITPSNGTVPERTICQAAADAQARNSPAAPGLARQCAAATAAAETKVQTQVPVMTEGTPGDVRLSRVYTGGGSAGVRTSDFVELRNRGQVVLNLDGWSLQYASARGANWQVIPLSGTIAPNQIYLIAAASLHPDQVAPLQLGMTSGKLALLRSKLSLEGSCPISGNTLVDFVGYGTADCSLGGAMTSGTALSAFGRRQDGCSDTRDNSADFTSVAPDDLDRASPLDICAAE